MKTSKQSNYQWLLDAGHCGWENEKRQRMNCDGTVTRLANMLKRARIDFSRVSQANRDTPISKRISKVKEVSARNKRCIYLSLQINNTVAKDPRTGVYAVATCRDRAGLVRIFHLLDQLYGPALKPKRAGVDVRGMETADVENLCKLLRVKCPKVLVIYYLPEGARYGIRKMVMRAMAQDLMKFIRSAEKHKPV